MDEGASVDEDDPELSCFCLVSSNGSVSLIAFHVRIPTQRVKLLTEASAGMLSRPAVIFLVHPNLHFGIIIWNFPMKSELVHSFWNLRRQLPLWTRVLKSLALGAGFAHEARVLRPLTWMNSKLG